MLMKIYFGKKIVFICDTLDASINKFLPLPTTLFVEEVNDHSMQYALAQLEESNIEIVIFYNKDFEAVQKLFAKRFLNIAAAGGLVLNANGEMLFIFRKNKWDLPKGKVDEGESLEDAAVREVQEETGLQNIELEAKIMSTFHTYADYGEPTLKETHWYKMKSLGSETLIPQLEEDIEMAKWLKKDELTIVFANTYPSIADVLTEFHCNK